MDKEERIKAFVEEYSIWKNRMIRSSKKAMKKEINRREEYLKNLGFCYRGANSDLISSWKRHVEEIQAYANVLKSCKRTMWKSEARQILNISGIIPSTLLIENEILSVMTDSVTISGRHLGRYLISLSPIRDFNKFGENIKLESVDMPFALGVHHPQFGEEISVDNICLGNIGGIVFESLHYCEIPVLIILLRQFLGSYYARESLYDLEDWPAVEKVGMV